ncbi:MAG TPA: hypothetical protein VFJ02_02395 [Vicinamibacterales bacterium]|nr:hypothetical protein [Vicinamibacterales bacterium]
MLSAFVPEAPAAPAGDDVRRQGASWNSEPRKRTTIAEIRAQILRRAMRIIGAILLGVSTGFLAVHTLLRTRHELAPATPVTRTVERQAFREPVATAIPGTLSFAPLDGTMFFTPRPDMQPEQRETGSSPRFTAGAMSVARP